MPTWARAERWPAAARARSEAGERKACTRGVKEVEPTVRRAEGGVEGMVGGLEVEAEGRGEGREEVCFWPRFKLGRKLRTAHTTAATLASACSAIATDSQ